MLREQAKFFWDDAWGPQPFNQAAVSVTAAATPSISSQALPSFSESTNLGGTPALPQITASPQSAPALQAVAAPGVGTELHIPVGLQGGGTQVGSVALSASDSAGEGSLAPPTLSAHWSDGWLIVPSAANEYGQAYAAGDGFGFDVATGEFTAGADWFLV